MKYLNSKQVGLKREIKCGGYKVNLLQSNTNKTLHERINEQIDSYRFQAEQKFAMRRELEELLGIDNGAPGDEQFKKGG